jgi:PIN domain nuclease of toxin-antitoxin system
LSLLLDSHIVLWWLTDDSRLGPVARRAIADAATARVSVACAWELGLKQARGKLTLPDRFAELVAEQGFVWMPIDLAHVAQVNDLPDHHGDPFDRIMIAQALVDGLRIVTVDRRFGEYHVDRLDART